MKFLQFALTCCDLQLIAHYVRNVPGDKFHMKSMFKELGDFLMNRKHHNNASNPSITKALSDRVKSYSSILSTLEKSMLTYLILTFPEESLLEYYIDYKNNISDNLILKSQSSINDQSLILMLNIMREASEKGDGEFLERIAQDLPSFMLKGNDPKTDEFLKKICNSELFRDIEANYLGRLNFPNATDFLYYLLVVTHDIYLSRVSIILDNLDPEISKIKIISFLANPNEYLLNSEEVYDKNMVLNLLPTIKSDSDIDIYGPLTDKKIMNLISFTVVRFNNEEIKKCEPPLKVENDMTIAKFQNQEEKINLHVSIEKEYDIKEDSLIGDEYREPIKTFRSSSTQGSLKNI